MVGSSGSSGPGGAGGNQGGKGRKNAAGGDGKGIGKGGNRRRLGGLGLVATRRMSKEIKELRARVTELEEAVQESRQLSKRLAEVTDIVAEVLLPAEQRDEERVRSLLQHYERSISRA